MRRSTLFTMVLAVPMALLLLSCDGGGSNGFNWPTTPPTGGDGVVSVTVPAGATFNGFDIWVDYDSARMTPKSPLASAVTALGLATESTCLPTQSGNEIRFSCAKATSMNGPGQIATFAFTYPSTAPTTANFSVDCDFYDEDGRPVALTCTGAWVE